VKQRDRRFINESIQLHNELAEIQGSRGEVESRSTKRQFNQPFAVLAMVRSDLKKTALKVENLEAARSWYSCEAHLPCAGCKKYKSCMDEFGC
jgi:BMFP domain-containing protein YqiC